MRNVEDKRVELSECVFRVSVEKGIFESTIYKHCLYIYTQLEKHICNICVVRVKCVYSKDEHQSWRSERSRDRESTSPTNTNSICVIRWATTTNDITGRCNVQPYQFVQGAYTYRWISLTAYRENNYMFALNNTHIFPVTVWCVWRKDKIYSLVRVEDYEWIYCAIGWYSPCSRFERR